MRSSEFQPVDLPLVQVFMRITSIIADNYFPKFALQCFPILL